MGLLALLGLLAVVAMILGPVGFLSSGDTRQRVGDLEKLVEARQMGLQAALQIIERRLQQIESKLAIRVKPAIAGAAPASAVTLFESLEGADPARRDDGVAEQSRARAPDEASRPIPRFD